MRVITILCGAILLASELSAGSMSIISFGSIPGFTNLPFDAVSSTTQYLLTQKNSGDSGGYSFTSSYLGVLSPNNLGLAVSVESACQTPCFVNTPRSEVGEVSSDGVTIGGVISGTLRLEYLLQGTVLLTGGNPNNRVGMTYGLSSGGLFFVHDVDQVTPAGEIVNGNLTSVFDGQATSSVQDHGFVELPILNGQVSWSQSLFTAADCEVTTFFSTCTGNVSFPTAKIGSAVVLDSLGHVVSGASITSQSGVDYALPIQTAQAGVPEPASWLLLSSALAAVFAVRRRRSG